MGTAMSLAAMSPTVPTGPGVEMWMTFGRWSSAARSMVRNGGMARSRVSYPGMGRA